MLLSTFLERSLDFPIFFLSLISTHFPILILHKKRMKCNRFNTFHFNYIKLENVLEISEKYHKKLLSRGEKDAVYV